MRTIFGIINTNLKSENYSLLAVQLVSRMYVKAGTGITSPSNKQGFDKKKL